MTEEAQGLSLQCISKCTWWSLVRLLPDYPTATIALVAGVGDTSATLVIGLFK